MKKITYVLFGLLIANFNYANPISNRESNSISTALPDCAILLYPSQGQTGVPIESASNNSVFLNWIAPLSGDPVVGYNIYLGQQPDALDLIAYTPDLSITFDAAFYNTTYYWQAVPVGNDGAAIACETWSFTTVAETPVVPDYLNNFSLESNDGWSRATGPLTGPLTKVVDNDWKYFEYANQSDGPNGSSATINIYNQFSTNEDWFISPLFDLSGGPHYLNFDIALTQFSDEAPATLSAEEFVALLVSENDGQTWTELERWDVNSTISNFGQAVSEKTLNQTGNTRFAFFASISDNTESNIDFFIDNFRITLESQLGLNQNEKPVFQCYPNPVADILNLSSAQTIKNVALYNLLGQQVLNKNINAMDSALDMSALPSGNYIAKITTDNAAKSIKLIKR